MLDFACVSCSPTGELAAISRAKEVVRDLEAEALQTCYVDEEELSKGRGSGQSLL